MSITSLIDQPAISELFKSFVPPILRGPPKPLLVPPLTEHYSFVGAAFDYLLRFYVQRLNPHADASSWIAAQASVHAKARELGIGKNVEDALPVACEGAYFCQPRPSPKTSKKVARKPVKKSSSTRTGKRTKKVSAVSAYM